MSIDSDKVQDNVVRKIDVGKIQDLKIAGARNEEEIRTRVVCQWSAYYV